MSLKRWAVPMVLMLTVVGSLSACNSDGATEISAAPDGTEPAAQSQDTTSAQTFNMTITGDVQANVTEADLTEQFFCPDFEGVNFADGSATISDRYWITFNFDHAGKTWGLNVRIDAGAPGTIPVTSYDSEVVLGLANQTRDAAYWDVLPPAGHSSGSITIAEDGKSGSLNVQNLIRPEADGQGGGPTVSVEGSWSC